MSDPTASVVIPYLDPPIPFFREAIASVTAQVGVDWELLLVDDGSGPEATHAASLAAASDGRIRLVATAGPAPAGISAARNVGVGHARGEFVAMLDADDVYEPGRLLRHVDALRANPDAALAVGNTLYWKSWSPAAEGEDHVPRIDLAPDTNSPPRLLVAMLTGGTAVPCACSFTVRRAVTRSTGAFDDRFQALYEDQVFLARIAGKHPIVFVPDTLDRYRLHPESLTAGASSEAEAAARRRFLAWVDLYCAREPGVVGREDIRRALRRARRDLDHPRIASVRRQFRKLRRRLGGTP